MKILITTDWYKPAINGVVTSVMNLQRALEDRGHEVRILTLSQNIHTYRSNSLLGLGSIPLKIIYPGARLIIGSSKKIIKDILDWEPDLIHSQCEFNTFFLAKKISTKLNIPLIHTYHTVYEDYTHYFSPNKSWGRGIIARLSRFVGRQTDCIIAPTEKVRNILEDYHVDCPIATVATGIELKQFHQRLDPEEKQALKAALNIPEGYRLAVYIGRIAKEKNLIELLEMWNLAQKDKCILLIVGGGPYLSEIKNKISELKLDECVRLAGMADPAVIWKYYQLGDVFVSASNSETQGLTYIEALASGLPLLCKRDSCLDDVVIDGINGWQYDDSDDFNDYLSLILSKITAEGFDRKTVAITAEKFSTANFAQKVEDVYLRSRGENLCICPA